MDERDRIIMSQVALKGAIDLVASSTTRDSAQIAPLTQTCFDAMLQVLGASGHPAAHVPAPAVQPPAQAAVATPQQVMENVVQAFPGTSNPAAPPGVPPAQPVGAESPQEVLWADALYHTPHAWDDVRRTKKNEKGPDFVHKTLKKADGKWNIGLFLNSQYDVLPSWVPQRLAELDAGVPVG